MIESNGNMYMPVAPAYGYGNSGNCGMFVGIQWAVIHLAMVAIQIMAISGWRCRIL